MKILGMRNVPVVASLLVPLIVGAQTSLSGQPETLYKLVVSGSNCAALKRNESLWRCEYAVGPSLRFSITVESDGTRNIAFQHSDAKDDFYAVVYGGCVAVVPAAGHPHNYGVDYVAYISTIDGRAYRQLSACKASKKD